YVRSEVYSRRGRRRRGHAEVATELFRRKLTGQGFAAATAAKSQQSGRCHRRPLQKEKALGPPAFPVLPNLAAVPQCLHAKFIEHHLTSSNRGKRASYQRCAAAGATRTSSGRSPKISNATGCDAKIPARRRHQARASQSGPPHPEDTKRESQLRLGHE